MPTDALKTACFVESSRISALRNWDVVCHWSIDVSGDTNFVVEPSTTRLSVRAAALFAPLLVVIAACGEGPSDGEHLGSVTSDLTTITRSQALSRGQQWVAAKLPYCQSANHQADGDQACAKVCTRPNNAQWDPYRSDCSGFVSWSWGLAAPGRTTADLAPAVTDITHTIDASTLMPGDAVNKPSDHTMLFVKWVTPGVRATFMEEPGCSSSTPYAHQIDSNVTINGKLITVAQNGITFSAIRFNAIVDDPDAGAPAPDSGGGGGGGGSTEDAASPVADDASAPSSGFGAAHDRATDTNGSGSSDGGGCAMSSASDEGAAWPALVLTLGLVAARRRRATRT